MILLFLASQVARITDVSHWYLAGFFVLFWQYWILKLRASNLLGRKSAT
jgi:hypothetical protein